jgi:hypothetical protein
MIKSLLFFITFSLLFLATNYSYCQSFHKKKLELVFAMDIFRHASRTPLYKISAFDKNIDYKLGVLTQNGIQSSLLMGVNLRSYYIKKNLLSEHCDPEKLLFRSTNFKRTKDTASFISKKMCPSNKAMKIIYYPMGSDDVLYPIIDKKYFKYNLTTKDRRAANQTLLTLKQAGILTQDSSINDIVKVGDIVKYIEHNQSIAPIILKESTKNKLKYIADKAISSLFYSNTLSCFVTEDLVKEISERLLTASSKEPKLKYILYSLHDINILSLLKILDYKPANLPVYLANLRLELFKEPLSDMFLVKVSYNNKVIKVCDSTYCKIRDFQNLLSNSYNLKCGHSTTP